MSRFRVAADRPPPPLSVPSTSTLPSSGRENIIRYHRDLLAEVEAIPGVSRVGMASDLMFTTENRSTSFSIDGRESDPASPSSTEFHVVTPEYFEVLGIPTRAGTLPERWPVGDEVPVVVNERMAAVVWPDGRPAQWYGKRRLLPFAEGVPFAGQLGFDPAEWRASGKGGSGYLSMLGNFSPGPEVTLLEVGPARIGVLICYEGLYASLAKERRVARKLLWGTFRSSEPPRMTPPVAVHHSASDSIVSQPASDSPSNRERVAC